MVIFRSSSEDDSPAPSAGGVMFSTPVPKNSEVTNSDSENELKKDYAGMIRHKNTRFDIPIESKQMLSSTLEYPKGHNISVSDIRIDFINLNVFLNHSRANIIL